MAANIPLNMSNLDPLAEESTKGYRILHSYPFINDGLKFNAEQDCAIVPKAKTINQPQEIKPAWKPVKLDEKPPYSYATLIAHAILSSKEKKMMLHEIYQWISEHYPCYSMKDHRWQNSIRHNLSLQKAFVKLERNGASSGKGCFWTILPGYEQQFIDNLVKRGMGRRSSQTTSYKQCRKFMADKHNSKNAPLFTIFRMNPTHETTKKLPHRKRDVGCDSDCDSAVDLGCDPLPMESCQPPPQQDYMHLLDPSFFDMSYLDEMLQPLDVQVNSWLDLQWQDLSLDMYPTYELPAYGQTENTFYI